MLRRLRIENLVLIREAELDLAPGLNALTGETGAGKTIIAQAVGLLLGARGEAAAVGPAGEEAYVEAELDVPDGFFDDEELAALGELRPVGEEGLVLARRVFGDGRTRAYAWGRAVAREDVAVAAERLVAMSGQFEQRRLARASYRLGALDAYCGPQQSVRLRDAREAWRALQAAQRRHDELTRDAGALAARLAELEALVVDTADLAPGEEEELRAERERLRHVTELGEAVAAAVQALEPEDGDGAASLAAAAERALGPAVRLDGDLARAAEEVRDAALRLRESASELRGYLASLEAEPERLERVEARLQHVAEARRRFRCASLDELLERRDAAQAELDALAGGRDPVEAAVAELAAADERFSRLAGELRSARREASAPFAEAVAGELSGLGLGEGEFRVELRGRDPGPTGADDAVFLVRPNPGLPAAPVAETASGGELSRIALALAAVAGGETIVLDEIDAGIGGTTAHAVADALRRLATHAQVLAITHLPQIASVAERHFSVEKVPGEPTHTRIERLGGDERRLELERMAGGADFVAALARGGSG